VTRYAVIGLGKAGRAVAGLLAERGLLVSAWTRNEATGAAAVAKLPWHRYIPS
jgi:3-hydroxyisobutyrate dehydrogenase-like beta-hydroxyacid dehydrogenase